MVIQRRMADWIDRVGSNTFAYYTVICCIYYKQMVQNSSTYNPLRRLQEKTPHVTRVCVLLIIRACSQFAETFKAGRAAVDRRGRQANVRNENLGAKPGVWLGVGGGEGGMNLERGAPRLSVQELEREPQPERSRAIRGKVHDRRH